MMNQIEPTAGPLMSRGMSRGLNREMPQDAQQSQKQQQSSLHKQNTQTNNKLWRASLAFETMFVQQLLSAMHKTVPSSGIVKEGFAEDVQSSMLNQALAKSIGGQGQLGIAKSIYKQINQLAQASDNHTDKIKKE